MWASVDRPLDIAILLACTLLATTWRPSPVAADRLEPYFRTTCEDRERPELRASPSWPWIAEVCAKEAAARSQEFREAAREHRLAMIALDCEDWYRRNAWRFGKRVSADAPRWAQVVAAKCMAEAQEELTRLDGAVGAIARTDPAGPPGFPTH